MAEEYYSEINNVQLFSKDYVLVVPGWYPTWQDQFTGDFNQRQVKAAAIYMPQVVLYIVKDQTQTLTNVETRYKQPAKNVVEITVMYPAKREKWFDAVYSNLMYVRLLFTYADIIKKRWGKPLLLHSYIVIRGGLGGMLLAKKWKIPFILSEHWSIYYPEDPGFLLERNFIFRTMVKIIFRNVKRFLPVTDKLKKQVYTLVKPIPATIIPNVVETEFFFYKEDFAEETQFRFVHVSNMVYPKNPEGLLRGFKKFIELQPGSILWMVGAYSKELLKYARETGLDENMVHFTGEVSYRQVAEILKVSHVLVLFSRYESLPCVILEALCCGVPVISTSVGGIPEVINAGNGILVDTENEQQLTDAFTDMFNNYKSYDREKMSSAATSLYSYKAIGKLINDVYREILTPL